MKKKKVWRYGCDFCGRSNCSGGSIAKHERHCTMNPNRVCRMCKAVGETQAPIAELIAALEFRASPWSGDEGPTEADTTKIRAVAHNCPACILAALRQAERDSKDAAGSAHYSENFNWAEERKAWIEDYHNASPIGPDADCHFDREEWLGVRAQRFARRATP